MIEKKITAKIDKVIKIGSLEEEQIEEIRVLDSLLPQSVEAPKTQENIEEPKQAKQE